ncbi:hypothetical protein [Nocardia sp. NPDC059154]|uniref:hypothetical protein n=1 Tax=Nocardia sp. NPDC059154 TaxID=3346744 RepID=UPI0036A538EE
MTISSRSLADSPLTDFPVAGNLVAQLDKLLADFGFSAWWAESVEFIVLVVTLFFVLQVLVGKLVPWLSEKLLGRVDLVTAPVPALLLAPEWVVTKFVVRSGRAPGPFVYSYGDGVLALADGLEVVVTAVLRVLTTVGKHRRLIAAVLVILGFLWWNSGTCVGDSRPCVSPAGQWSHQASAK